MVRTRADNLRDIKYVLVVMMGFPDDGDVMRAIIEAGYEDLPSFIPISDDEMDDIIVQSGDHKRQLNKMERGKITAFQSFIIHRQNIGKPVKEGEFGKLDVDEFNGYRTSADFISVRSGLRGPPNLIPDNRDPVYEFKRGIKRDITHYIMFKEDKQWGAWQRSTIATARSRAVDDVFDSNYNPSRDKDAELFKEKQKFVYAVFELTLQTDQGKAFVREHAKDGNAQKIYKKLVAHYQNSTAAAVDSEQYLQYITTAKLGDGTWNGSNESFILHWKDQLRRYENLIPAGDHMKDSVKLTLLQNAVRGIPDLRKVKDTADQLKAHDGKEVTYSSYLSLLLSAAVSLDRSIQPRNTRNIHRNIYSHDVLPSGDQYDDIPPDLGEFESFDIDSDINLIEAY